MCRLSFLHVLLSNWLFRSNGQDMKEWVKLMGNYLTFPHIKVMYPTAPLQPYSPALGEMSNVWFDRLGITPNVPEVASSLASIELEVKNLIKKENDAGIPSKRIVVGGFSMGGALALQTAFRWDKNLAGAFAFSSFLNKESLVYQELKRETGVQFPPLLQIHGDNDDLVSLEWGESTHRQLKDAGVTTEFHVLKRLGHSINRGGMRQIKEWIDIRLPEI